MNHEEPGTHLHSAAESSLHMAVQRFLDTASIAISIKDRAGRYLFANQFFCAIVERDLAQVIGHVSADVFPQATAQLMQTWDQHVLATAAPTDCELTLVQGDAVRNYCEKRVPLIDTAGQVSAIGIMMFDVTDHKHEKAQLHSQQETALVLRERERLVLEVQSRFDQMLDRLRTQIQGAQESLTSGDDTRASTLLTDILALVRETQHTMHASTLGINIDAQDEPTFAALYDEKGFVPALREFVQRVASKSGLPIVLDIPLQLQYEEFPAHVQVHLLHIIQEVLLNAQKHHTAHNVHIRLALVDRTLMLTISHYGYQEAHQPHLPQARRRITDHAYGLRRVYEIGGGFHVKHDQPNSITIQVHIPLRRAGDLRAASLRVLLADASASALQRMHEVLVLYGIQVVGLAHDGREVQEKARSLNPDIILIDTDLPPCNGVEAMHALKAELPDIQVVMLADTTDETICFEAMRSGASGYLLKDLPPDELTSLLLGVCRGEVALSPGVAHKLLASFAEQELQPASAQLEAATPTAETLASDLSSQLSPRQMEILWLVAQDYTYKQVGDILGFSERTIKYYMSSIIKQLHLRNRADAVAFVRQRMTHSPPPPDTDTQP
jgi:two-component system NarL family response regulator